MPIGKRAGAHAVAFLQTLSLLIFCHEAFCADAPRNVPDNNGVRDVWLPWHGQAPAPGHVAQKRLCPEGRWVTQLTVIPGEVVAGTKLPGSAAGVLIPHAAVQSITAYCSVLDAKEVPWWLLPADTPEVPLLDDGELVISRDPVNSTVYGDASRDSVGLVNITTTIASNGSFEGAWISSVTVMNYQDPAAASDSASDPAFIDVCPPGMFISGYQVNQGNVIYGLSWRCSCRNCGCRCLATPEPTCHVRPSSTKGLARLPWCFLEADAKCSLPTNPPTTQAALGPWYWCEDVTSTSVLSTQQTIQGCSCAPQFTYLHNGRVPELITSAGSCITEDHDGKPWCFVLPGSCPSDLVLSYSLDASGKSLPYDNCTGSPGGDGPPLVVVTHMKEAGTEPQKVRVQGGTISAIVLGSFLVGLALAGLVSAGRYWVSHQLHSSKVPIQHLESGKLVMQKSPFASGEAGLGVFDSAKHSHEMRIPPVNGKASPLESGASQSDGVQMDRDPESMNSALESLNVLSSRPSWRLSPKDIEIVKHADGTDWLLGSGAYGKVYRGLNGMQPVAIKVMDATDMASRQAVLREITILMESRNPHIVQFLGACVDEEGHMLVVMELMDQGTLYHAIAEGRVSWYTRGRKIALDVALGLGFLHSHNIVHLDIKSGNVLLARNMTAKISDVGLARVLHTQSTNSITGVGTFHYASPEVLIGGMKVTEAADIYSYGVLLWELITTEQPTRGNLREVKVPDECPQQVADLMKQCVLPDASKRPTAEDIVARLSDARLGRKNTSGA